MSIKSRLKQALHWHKFSTLLIYPPHNQRCDQEQCKDSNDYGFLIRCDCGYTKLTKLPNSITEIFNVVNEQEADEDRSFQRTLDNINNLQVKDYSLTDND